MLMLAVVEAFELDRQPAALAEQLRRTEGLGASWQLKGRLCNDRTLTALSRAERCFWLSRLSFCCALGEYESSFSRFSLLRRLDLNKNQLQSLPQNFAVWTQLRRLGRDFASSGRQLFPISGGNGGSTFEPVGVGTR